MTKGEVAVILTSVAANQANEKLKDDLLNAIDHVEIKRNLLGDQFFNLGRYSVASAKIKNKTTGKETYNMKLFFGGYDTQISKQWIAEEDYLKELEYFINLMVSKTIGA